MLMNVLVIMDVITCAITLMGLSLAIVIQATCLICKEPHVEVNYFTYINNYLLHAMYDHHNNYIDIDECAINNGGCEFSCTNLEGIGGLTVGNGSGSTMDSAVTNLGYQCGCDTGYQLAPNNHDCVGMNIFPNSHACVW